MFNNKFMNMPVNKIYTLYTFIVVHNINKQFIVLK